MIVLALVLGAVAGLSIIMVADRLPRLVGYEVAIDLHWRWQEQAIVVGCIVGSGLLASQVSPETYIGLAALFAFFLLVTVIDIRHHLILDITMYPAMILILVSHVLLGADMGLILLGGLFGFVIFYGTQRINPGNLGGGDVKLATLIGLLLGFPGVLWALLVGGGAGALAAGYLLLARREDRQFGIAYGPFLCLGAAVALVVNPFLTIL